MSQKCPSLGRNEFTRIYHQDHQVEHSQSHSATVPAHWPQPLRLGPDHFKGRMKIGVTEEAVVKRLQRALLANGQYLRVADSRKQKRWGFGRYYLLDAKGVIDKNVNIEQLARKLGVVVSRKAPER
jgi:hypothetical protein